MTSYRQGDIKRKGSKFHDEGKWETFVEPLLSADCTNKTFVEMGCNLGMYLGIAKKKGFRYVYGVEKDAKVLKQLNGEYNVLHEDIESTFVPNHLPVADVTLLANVHYHLQVESFLEYLDTLPSRTLYCIIVSTRGHSPKGIHRFAGRLIDIPRFFSGWTVVKTISGISRKGDPKPRKLFSILLRSNKLIEVDIEDYLETSARAPVYAKRFDEFIEQSLTDPAFDPETHPVSESHRKGRSKALCKLVKSVTETGITRPPIVAWRQLLDGYHRMRILRYLGYKKIIARIL